MSAFEIFIFGCLNFTLLLVALVWGLRRLVRQFLYARRTVLKKQMVTQSRALREARAHARGCRCLAASLPRDIAQRKAAMMESAERERQRIVDEAERRATALVDAASRQVEEERARAVAETRSRILAKAFERAGAILEAGMTDDLRRRAVDRGMVELPALVADEQRRALQAGGGR